MESTDLVEDQRHFDDAVDARERSRRRLTQAPEAALHRGGADAIRKATKQAINTLGQPDEAVAFGRMDTDDEEIWYIGKHAIHDDDQDPLVINWKVPAAQPYYAATASNPAGVVRKRSFTSGGNTIINFDDVVFAQLSEDVAQLEEQTIDDALLQGLERHRGGEMVDIVQTIQAAQYDLLRADKDQLLVIEGGPGTGKTAIGLHRVSWLLFNHHDELDPHDVLIVGPNRTFVRYIRQVLPGLGDTDVVQVDLHQLGPTVRGGRNERDEVALVKGELRMQGLIQRALAERVRRPNDSLVLSAAGSRVQIGIDELRDEIRRLRRFAYAEGRTQLRTFLRSQVIGRHDRDAQPFEEEISKATDRIWPALTAEALIQDLYGSRTRLVAAAGEDFTGNDIERLYRQAATRISQEHWSEADVPVLDHARFCLGNTKTETYGHIVIDEAQDLSPMQAAALARRSRNGSMTVLGDIYQSTGLWARDSWDDLVEVLGAGATATIESLRYCYRVPKQVYEFAESILHRYEPDAPTPDAIRPGRSDPEGRTARKEDFAVEAVEAARSYAADGCSVGVICPPAHWDAVTEKLTELDVRWTDANDGELSGSINVVRPSMAKGLEFDAVVIVDPVAVVKSTKRGHRLLYIATTRTTTYLTTIWPAPEDSTADDADGANDEGSGTTSVTKDPLADTIPDETGSGTVDVSDGQVSRSHPARGISYPSQKLPRIVEAVSEIVADEIRELQPERWAQALRRAAELLDVDLDE